VERAEMYEMLSTKLWAAVRSKLREWWRDPGRRRGPGAWVEGCHGPHHGVTRPDGAWRSGWLCSIDGGGACVSRHRRGTGVRKSRRRTCVGAPPATTPRVVRES
jgi:hypothetical protein